MNEQLIGDLFVEAQRQMSSSSSREFSEKFAELIVAEMLQTCEDHPGWSGRMIGEKIKQHFGVEE
jgi:hypothetical protein